MKIDGTAAVVTGGAWGLGEATARALAAKGAKVAIFDRDVDNMMVDHGRPTGRDAFHHRLGVDQLGQSAVQLRHRDSVEAGEFRSPLGEGQLHEFSGPNLRAARARIGDDRQIG